jgi:hypothetical protein
VFRAGLSAAHQIMHLLYDITTNFNNENLICVDAVFLDKNDAFDSVKIKLILEDFFEIGLRDSLILNSLILPVLEYCNVCK